MTFYDKSGHKGFDDRDKELNTELNALLQRSTYEERQILTHRIHDAILQRMREESARKCWDYIQKYETCVNTNPILLYKCRPHRDALNSCAHQVNNEDVYQRYRIAFLRGELKKLYEQKQNVKMEAFKSQAPQAISMFRADYAPKYAESMVDLGLEPEGNIVKDDLKEYIAEYGKPELKGYWAEAEGDDAWQGIERKKSE